MFLCALIFFFPSETLYKDLFSSVAEILGAVFKQCHQVQCKFFAILTLHINYDSSVQSDIDDLVEGTFLPASCQFLRVLFGFYQYHRQLPSLSFLLHFQFWRF